MTSFALVFTWVGITVVLTLIYPPAALAWVVLSTIWIMSKR